MKGYITRWEEQKSKEGGTQTHFPSKIDVFFDHRPEKAAWWPTREQAQGDIPVFENWRIVIPSAEGGTYVCKDFFVEEFKPEHFVIYCEAPFLPPRPEGYPKPQS